MNQHSPHVSAVLFLTLAFLTLSCASGSSGGKAPPLWVRDREAAYPNSEWLCAVETGADKDAVQAAALAALAQSFRVDIASVSKSSHAYARAVKQNGAKSISSSEELLRFSRETTAASSVSGLMGVEQDHWVSPTGEVWALARMNRAQCAARYQNLIVQNERLVAALMDRARKNRGAFEAYAALSFASEAAAFTDGCAAILSVLRPGGTAYAPSYGNAETVRAAAKEAAGRMVVDIRVTGDSGGQMANAFSRVLTLRGFRTGRGGSFALAAQFRLEDAPQADRNFVYARFTLTAALKDASGTELFAWSGGDRQGHILQMEARQRALDKAEELVTETGFAPALDAWLLSLL